MPLAAHSLAARSLALLSRRVSPLRAARRPAAGSAAGAPRGAARVTASALRKAELFLHPTYGRAVRATERIPAGSVVLEERPLLTFIPTPEAAAEAMKAAAALNCHVSVPARMLAFCAAPQAVRDRVLQLYDGGGPAQWPKQAPDSDTFPDAVVLSSDNTAMVAPAVAAWLIEHCALARGFAADTLARAALVVSLNAHGLAHPAAGGAEVNTLFDQGSKFAHACAPNAYYKWDKENGVLTHKTFRDVAPGEPVTVDYHTEGSAESTPVRRHRLMRAKFFRCECELCAAPDALAALPCPACAPRAADGRLPMERVFASSLDALRMSTGSLPGCFISLKDVPIAVPEPAADDVPQLWRCASCGGAFSRDELASAEVADVLRPQPRGMKLSAQLGAAPLLDVARWAERVAVEVTLTSRRSVDVESVCHASETDSFAPGGRGETLARLLGTYIAALAPLVGPAHAAITQLRLLRLQTALRGAFTFVLALPPPCPPAQLEEVVCRLMGVRSGTAAAAMSAAELLTAEMASLKAALTRANRLAALRPVLIMRYLTTMMELGGLQDPKTARFALSLLQDVTRLTANGAAHEESLADFKGIVEVYAAL